jgi:carbamoyl-phosphate synthase large subunit
MRSGVTVPASWLPGIAPEVLPEDLFLKPRDGSASQHTHACLREDLEHILPLVPNPIIQERLKGREITIDALFDFEGRPLHFVPRERIRTLGGESIQGVTLGNEELETWLSNVLDACSLLGARGAITLQAFLTPLGPVLTEVNPRFGGGFPLANAAGGNYPQWLLAMLAGEPVNPQMGVYIRGLYMTRCYTEVFTETLPWSR